MYKRVGVGAVSDTLATAWQDFVDFWNPKLTTSEVAANVYERANYGNIPTPTPGTVPGGAAPGLPLTYDASTGTVTDNTTGETVAVTDPTARGQALRDLINQAIASGQYTPDNPPVASDIAAMDWKNLLLVGGIILGGVLVLPLVVGGRR